MRKLDTPPPATPRRRAPRKRADAAAAPPPERPRGGEARAIVDLLPAVSGTAFRKFGFVQSALVTRWDEIVGARLARVTRPQSLRFPVGEKRDGTLTLAVMGAHGPMVQHLLPDIVDRANRFFGYAAVARVKIVAAAHLPAGAAPQRAAPPAPRTAAAAPAPSAPKPELSRIADPELRAVLEALGASLAKRADVPKIR